MTDPTIPTPVPNDTGPIHDYECEKAVLVYLMTSFSAAPEVMPQIDEECFFDPINREIYTAINAIHSSGNLPDMITVSAQLAKQSSQISMSEIAKLCTGCRPILSPDYYTERLVSLSLRRKLWEIGVKLVSKTVVESDDIEAIQTEAKNSIDRLYEKIDTQYTTLQDAYDMLHRQMVENMNRKDVEIFGTPTGFPYIDRNGGLIGGNMIIVAAETSQGKTSFATSMAVNAIRCGKRVAFYSMEMMNIQLAARIGAMASGVSASRLLYQKLEQTEIDIADTAISKIGTENLFFDDRSTASLKTIVTSIRCMKARFDIDGAVVDYLQLVGIENSKIGREEATAEIARCLKNLAKDLNIWIIAISQLAREKGGGVPTKARLRNSGQIEEAADDILLLYRPPKGVGYPEPYKDVPTDGTAMVIADKGRSVGTGSFICGFRPETTHFYPLDDVDICNLKNSLPSSPILTIEDDVPF